MALAPVDTALALFEVDGVARQIPVHDRMAELVEVQALLSGRRRRQHERLEDRP